VEVTGLRSGAFYLSISVSFSGLGEPAAAASDVSPFYFGKGFVIPSGVGNGVGSPSPLGAGAGLGSSL
jgi:hypothetical protein